MSKDGRVLECLTSNVIFGKGGRLVTVGEGVLEGIALKCLIEEYGVEVREVRVEEIRGFEKCWICNAVRGVKGVGVIMDERGEVVWRDEGKGVDVFEGM